MTEHEVVLIVLDLLGPEDKQHARKEWKTVSALDTALLSAKQRSVAVWLRC